MNLHLNRRENNFDLLRLAAAMLVLLSHSYDMWHMRSLEPLRYLLSGRHLFSTFGLIIFFAMSGFLVSKSLVESSTIKDYLFKRFLRIWPAYTVCNIVCVFTIGLAFTALPSGAFLVHSETLDYIFGNALLMRANMSLPGVFNGSAVNASLWTIPLETKLYLLLLVLYLIGLFKRKFILIILYVGLLILKTVTSYLDFSDVAGFNLSGFHGLTDYFLGGTICYLYRDKIPFRFIIWLSLFIAWILVVRFAIHYSHLVESPFLVYSVVYFGCYVKKVPFIKADLSYGTYLYAYPIQQAVKYAFYGQLNFVVYNIVVMVITLALAACSWFLIEKKALALKKLTTRKKPLPDKPSDQPHNKTYEHK